MVIGNSEGGGGVGGVISITQVFKRKYEAILEIPGGRRVQSKEPSLGEVWILFGTTHFRARSFGNILQYEYILEYIPAILLLGAE